MGLEKIYFKISGGYYDMALVLQWLVSEGFTIHVLKPSCWSIHVFLKISVTIIVLSKQ